MYTCTRHCDLTCTYLWCVYNMMKALSVVYTVLIFAALGGLFVTVASTQESVQLEDCPSLTDPVTGSGANVRPANISNDEYCLIDQCNVKLVATGELLEVTSLSTDYLITTNKSSQQLVTISRQPNELGCFIDFIFYGAYFIINVLAFIFRFLLLLLIAVASGYILGLHIMFKMLCKLLGKLLIVYNAVLLAALFATLLLIMSSLLIAPGSQAVCQVFVHGYSMTFMMYESVGTAITAQVYYMMYRDYKNMADISPTWSSQLFEHYMMFSFAPMLPMAILTIGFDFTAKVGNETILPTGHCILPPSDLYESLFLAYMYIAIHKIAQLVIFIFTLHYFHKLYVSFDRKEQPAARKSSCQGVTEAEPQATNPSDTPLASESSSDGNASDDDSIEERSSTPQYSGEEMQEHTSPRILRHQMTREEARAEKKKYLRRLMISASFPGATILTVIFWFLCLAAGPLLKPFLAGGGGIALLVQQAIIAAVFLSSKKVFGLCRDRLEALTGK